ncbi:hypothetical protein ACMFMG_010723 [Clarireedia jacksonii]
MVWKVNGREMEELSTNSEIPSSSDRRESCIKPCYCHASTPSFLLTVSLSELKHVAVRPERHCAVISDWILLFCALEGVNFGVGTTLRSRALMGCCGMNGISWVVGMILGGPSSCLIGLHYP